MITKAGELLDDGRRYATFMSHDMDGSITEMDCYIPGQIVSLLYDEILEQESDLADVTW